MKISEIILILQEAKEKRGDLDLTSLISRHTFVSEIEEELIIGSDHVYLIDKKYFSKER